MSLSQSHSHMHPCTQTRHTQSGILTHTHTHTHTYTQSLSLLIHTHTHTHTIQHTLANSVKRMISSQVKLREGVPQGGVVSPTLFLVYMNDITTTVPRHVSNTLHADDFAVWCAEEHTSTAVHRIQNTINEVCSWTESWALQLNTTKTARSSHCPPQRRRSH